MESKKVNKLSFLTVFIILGVFVSYIAQMGPSPVLTLIMDDLNISLSDAGFSISVIFIPIIIVSLIGPYIQERIGLKNMFILTMIANIVGILFYYVSTTFALLLVGRIIYGVGFGLSVPFIGAAIMHWYTPKQQVSMNTVNALFPYVANLIVYGFTIPLFEMFSDSWQAALAIWGFVGIVIVVIWIIGAKNEGPIKNEDEAGKVATGKNVYLNLLKRKEIIILIIAFVCDFISYSIVSGLLPTYYITEHGMSETMANNLTLIFPFAGIAGGLVAFGVMAKTGRRKTLLWMGQAFKVAGVLLIFFFGASPLGYVGVAAVGVGNCLWIPALYIVPMELEDMSPTLVGAAFALITSCGFVSGFIAPPVAGWFGENFSLNLAIGLCAIPCTIGMIACFMIRETGPGAKKKAAA